MRLTVATLNVGSAPVYRVLGNLAGIDVIGLQEMGDRHDLRAAMVSAGWRFIDGTRRGQQSTPLAYRVGRAVHIRSVRRLLAGAQYVGVGAGPATLKPKWLIGGVFKVDGVRVFVGNTHFVASQWNWRRQAVARSMSARIADAVTWRRRAVVVGDFNAEADARQLHALRGVLKHTATPATHGHRSIDLIWHRSPKRNPFRVITEGTRSVGSDHRLHYATLETNRRHR